MSVFWQRRLYRGTTYNTTIAYQPGVSSTSVCTGEPEGFYRGVSALNLTALEHSTSYNRTCLGLDISMGSTTNGPYYSLPQDLTLVDPAWDTGNAVRWGAFDPPITLHTATALVPDPGMDSPPTPAPGSPAALPHAPATPTAPAVTPGKPATHSPAPKAGPQPLEQQSPHPSDPVKSTPPTIQSLDPKILTNKTLARQYLVRPSVHNSNNGPAVSSAVPIPVSSG